LFVERDFGASQIYSGLAGAIWRVKENLSFDVGLRSARVDLDNAYELRAGFTCATSLWGSQ